MKIISLLQCGLRRAHVAYKRLPKPSTAVYHARALDVVRRRPCRGMSTTSEFGAFTPSQDHALLRQTVRNFAEAEVASQALDYNRDGRFNIDLFRELGDLGLLGVTVPEQFGGAGFDATAACIVHEELSASDPAFCLSYLAHSLLFANNLARNGSEEQKHRYLPAACSGKLVGGMCMSEPGAGADVFEMRTKADKVDGGGSYVLNGSKMWITNGTLDGETTGDAFLVYAKTDKGDGKQGLSLFLVEKDTEGFRLGQQIKDKCGMWASMTAELVFDNCKIPAENLVGVEHKAGACMMRNLEIERLGLAAMSCGIARRCVELMVEYALQRKGEELPNFGQIQRLVAESYAGLWAGRALMYQTAQGLDLEQEATSVHKRRVETDAGKLFYSKMAKDAADAAMKVQYQCGYSCVADYQVDRLWRDAKMLEIFGGTNELHHKNILRDLSAPGRGVFA